MSKARQSTLKTTSFSCKQPGPDGWDSSYVMAWTGTMGLDRLVLPGVGATVPVFSRDLWLQHKITGLNLHFW